MNKTDLIDIVASKGNKKYIAKKVVNELFNEIKNSLVNGDKVVIRGFGTFEVKNFKGHNIRHPETKEVIELSDFKNVVFTSGEELIKAVRKK